MYENLPDDVAQKLADGATLSSALDGKLVRNTSTEEVFFVWNGEKCFIPNADTFNNLFRNWDTIIDLAVPQIDQIPTGTAISDGALLIKGDSSDPIYLLTNGYKNWITSPATMDYCNFNKSAIRVYPQIVIDSIPAGSNISYGE